LTLAIELTRHGFDPLVIERKPSLHEGYMMDFFGAGWDVAARMGLTEALRSVRYPIDILGLCPHTDRTHAQRAR
jgi:2-polyprenyl-6-methoxyphenol hydroxylase-like FAD-dependent oxidoreductase